MVDKLIAYGSSESLYFPFLKVKSWQNRKKEIDLTTLFIVLIAVTVVVVLGIYVDDSAVTAGMIC